MAVIVIVYGLEYRIVTCENDEGISGDVCLKVVSRLTFD